MHPLEQRVETVELFLKYDRNSAAVGPVLGYPSRAVLGQWVAEYESTGSLHGGCRSGRARHSEAQKKAAVEYYLEHGRNFRGTVRALGYPSRRCLRETKKGLLRIDWAKVRDEERLDGKYLLRTSDDTLAAEDVVLGYKQLVEIEAAFRTLKTTLDLRPVYHRLDDRIRAHVVLCWLTLLLIRVAELRTDKPWPQIRDTLQRMHLGEFILGK